MHQVRNKLRMMLFYSSFKKEKRKKKETKFLCFLCREERSEWKCSGAGMEWRVTRMNGGREVHRSSGKNI